MLPPRQSQHTIQNHFSSAKSSDAKFIAILQLLINWSPISRAAYQNRGQFTHGNHQHPTDQLEHKRQNLTTTGHQSSIMMHRISNSRARNQHHSGSR
ncbi:hypothetical protein Nepgr_020372 [Nepenthes gracilis]|uniref:Uncharacterized protein n=1 Tax=Nepenthes gracilis TaxID=150966 RepID=A0AAD3SYX0_NEPGR|nr:hypothetical protein Nepgr_020372 [Nepenthes gracilis]